MRGGFSLYIGPGPGEPRRGPWISEGLHSLVRLFILILFPCNFNSNSQFWEKSRSVPGSQSSLVPSCSIFLGGPGSISSIFETGIWSNNILILPRYERLMDQPGKLRLLTPTGKRQKVKKVFWSSYNVEVELYEKRIQFVVHVYWLSPPTTTETH